MTGTPITEQQLDNYAALAILADHDGVKLDPQIVTVLVDEIRRLQQQRRYLMRAIARKDAETGRGDAALRGFLAGADSEPDTAAPTP